LRCSRTNIDSLPFLSGPFYLPESHPCDIISKAVDYGIVDFSVFAAYIMAIKQKEKSERIFGWPTDWWIAISTIAAVIVALSALFFSISETHLSRQNARVLTQPELYVTFFYTPEGAGFQMGNGGLGPAKLKWFVLFVDGKP